MPSSGTEPRGRDGGEVALERPEIVDADHEADKVESDETIDHPAKVMRIGSMLKQLLEEVRSAKLDEASRHRLREIYETSVTELGSALSPDLRAELGRLTLPFDTDTTPTAAELQIAKAQLVGWLEGLVQGMQAMLFAQQMAAQHQLQTMRGQLPPGDGDGRGPGATDRSRLDDRPGTYL
jgi:hypothetical protein